MADYGTLDYCGIDSLAYDEAGSGLAGVDLGALGYCGLLGLAYAVPSSGEVLYATKSIEVLASSTSSLTKPAVIFASAAATTESSIASWASDVVSVVRSAVSMAEKDESLSAIVEAYGSDINDLYRAVQAFGSDAELREVILELMSQSAEEAARSIEALASSSVYAERLIGVSGASIHTLARAAEVWGVVAGEENLELSIVLFGAADSSKIAYFVLSCSVAAAISRSVSMFGSALKDVEISLAVLSATNVFSSRGIAGTGSDSVYVESSLATVASSGTEVALGVRLWGYEGTVSVVDNRRFNPRMTDFNPRIVL